MAKVGFRYPAIMKITGYDTDGYPVYGNGIFVGKGVKADLSYDTSDADLYADDGRAEYDNGATGYSGTLEVDGFGTHQSGAKETPLSVLAYMSGAEVEAGSSSDKFKEALETTGAMHPYCGMVYIKRGVMSGKTIWTVKHCYKVSFSIPDESDETKGQTTNFGTTSVNFTGMGVDVTGKDDQVFAKDYKCESLDDAIALLKQIAKIQDPTTSGGGAG